MNIFDSIEKLKLTEKQRELFNALSLNSIFEILSYYPSRYNIFLETDLNDNERVVVSGKINSEPKLIFYQGKKNRINFTINYRNMDVKVIIFNRHFIINNLKNADEITIIGQYSAKNNTIVAQEIKFSSLSEIAGIYPIYTLALNYKNANYLTILKKILLEYRKSIYNIIPDEYLKKYQLLTREDAIINIHFPKSQESLVQANRTLIYEEFFVFALKAVIEQKNKVYNESLRKTIDINDVQTLTSNLNYNLTKDQRMALNDIYKDLISPSLMNRLILADVGSGKTLVAFISAYMVYNSGYQSALMAPTTILATQHYYSALQIFKDIEFNVALLTSNTNEKEREAILNDLKKGKIDLLIGTHAIYQDDVIFKNLGFVVYDEQQRFGVKQRALLKNKGEFVEQLMLSATPIPRTLAQVAYSSIQVTYMKETLPFKKPIKSYYFQSSSIKPFYKELNDILANKQQAYIVTPLVEESESIDTKNANDVYENIKKHFDGQYRVGLVHGKMDNKSKEDIMKEFARHEIDILVTTSLIEVGISVDNASCIIIYDAHRFGLSQLHQLRGRVGRGDKQGYCVFLSSSKDQNVIEKLQYITDNNDGFAIAEYDLETRGPGDILGIKQSGLPSFNLANPFKDKKIYQIAYQDALEFAKNNDRLIEWVKTNKSLLNIEKYYFD